MKIMRKIWLWLCALAIPCMADTRIDAVESTQMQAKVSVHTDQAGFCTYRASRGGAFSANLPDLADNGNTDGRAGSLVDGENHVFILGTRKGPDALAAAATYWAGVTCGADAEVSTTFTTLPIPWGNMAPDPVPFNAARFGNMDYPTIDWNDQTKSYVDPVSGVEFWRLTGPGITGAGSFTAQFNKTAGAPIDLSGNGNWTNTANSTSNGTSFATASGGPSDRLLLPLAPGNFFGAGGWNPKVSTDDILANVFCGNASQSGVTFTLQLTFDGGQTLAGRPVITAACPTGSPVKIGTYPQAAPAPVFHGWGINAPQHNLVIPPAGTVSVASSVATVQSPAASSNYFPTEWTPGTPILINSNYYHIASVQSPTQLTLVEDPGVLTNVAYTGANAGVVLVKNGGGSVNMSVGLDMYGSSVADPNTNGDLPMVNPVPVNVSKSADGSATLDPALKGYLMAVSDQTGAGAILLYIPYNADGSVRNETRLMATGVKPSTSATVNVRGDTAEYQFNVGVNPSHTSAFDGLNGNRWYGLSGPTNAGKFHFFRMTYDETLAGCAGYPAYNPYPASAGYNAGAAQKDDCFQYYNLTPTAGNLDIKSQMIRGYQTGLNTAGQPVGPAHPNFDLGWLGDPQGGITGGGFLTASIANRGEHLGISAAFDPATGVLSTVRNLWGGDADTEVRWGGIHGIPITAGSWRFASVNALDDNTGTPGAQVFNTAFDLPLSMVNRSGFGQAAQWSAAGQTALAGNEAYTCPPDNLMPARYQLASMRALGYTGPPLGGSNNCVQVKATTPPCSAHPNATFIFPDGKTEKDEFPCTTPGFGLADPNRSKLMDMQAGDWMWERRTGPLNEKFVALSVTYNGTNDIDIWLLRWARHNYLLPLMRNGDDFIPSFEARPNGWFLSMAPTFSTGSCSMAIDYSQGAAAKWLADNGARSEGHGVIGAGTLPGTFIYATPNVTSYMGQFNMTPGDMLFKGYSALGPGFPKFAGSGNGAPYSVMQNYNNNSWTSGAANPPFQLDFRHMNPSFGGGAELFSSGLGGQRTLTPVPGTTKSYLIADVISAGPSDYKRLPLYGFAGHYLLRDVSGPATGNTSDLPDYSVCRALRANECFAGSAAGNLYVTVPKAYLDNFCRSDQFTLPDPCAFQLSPYAGQLIQFRTDKPDTSGLTARKLGYVHGMPGLQYQFSNCRATPDAAFAFCVADWLDGVRSEWVALRIAPMPEPDAVNRTTFVPVNLTFQGTPDASFIRARFGYLENGGSLLRCTAYKAECSTEIPAAAPGDPYSFTNEAVTRQPCARGSACKITIPAISNRMLYYVVDRLDSNGGIVTSYPMQVVRAP